MKRYRTVNLSIMGFILISVFSSQAQDFVTRLQIISDHIDSIAKYKSLAIDDIYVTDDSGNNGPSKVITANYLTDGIRHKMERKEFEAPTLEEAVKKCENSDNQVDSSSKIVWIGKKQYSAFGVNYNSTVRCYLDACNLPIENPLYPFAYPLCESYKAQIAMYKMPEYSSTLAPQTVTLPDGNPVVQYYVKQKHKDSETFVKFQFSIDPKMIWPLSMEWGPHIQGKDIVTFRMIMNLDSSSILGYSGFEYESFSFDQKYMKSLLAHIIPSFAPTTVSALKVKTVLKTMPVMNRQIPEGEFDFLVKKGNQYCVYEKLESEPTVTVADEKDIVIRPE